MCVCVCGSAMRGGKNESISSRLSCFKVEALSNVVRSPLLSTASSIGKGIF